MIFARISAINEIGQSVPSIANSVGDLVEIVPHKPEQPPLKNAETTQDELVIDFTHLIGDTDGGSPITSYVIQWDQGETVNNFVDL
jgi:hypothetical protein